MRTTMATENNNKTLNVPNLRFPEFSGEWKSNELHKVASLSKGTGISKDQLSDSGHPCILYGELYTKYKSEIIREVYSKTQLDVANLVKSHTNDVIIPCSGEAAIEIATARCVLISEVLLGGDLNIIRLNGCHDGGFFAYQLNGKRKVDIAKVAQGVSVVHLYGEHLKKVKVSYPSLKEQQKISSFLALLDERIATQIKIIEDLKKLKSAIRARVFKQLESNCECWTEIGNMLQYEQPSKYLVASTEYSDSYATPVLTANKAFILGYTDEEFGIYSKGECVIFDDFTMDVKYVNFPFKVKSSAIKILTSNSGNDLYFVYEYLQNLGLVSEEHKRHYISEIEPMIVACPTFEEQQNISNLLRSFDSKIECANRELTLYNKQKQYLLSQMFI